MSNDGAKKSIVNLNLMTKNKRKISKSENIQTEIDRLTRANGYIEGEVEQICFYERNEARIVVLTELLSVAKVLEEKEIT